MKDGKKKTRVFYLIRKENEIRPTDVPSGNAATGFYQDVWDNNQSTKREIQRKNKKRKISVVSIARPIPTVSPTRKSTSHRSESKTPEEQYQVMIELYTQAYGNPPSLFRLHPPMHQVNAFCIATIYFCSLCRFISTSSNRNFGKGVCYFQSLLDEGIGFPI